MSDQLDDGVDHVLRARAHSALTELSQPLAPPSPDGAAQRAATPSRRGTLAVARTREGAAAPRALQKVGAVAAVAAIAGVGGVLTLASHGKPSHPIGAVTSPAANAPACRLPVVSSDGSVSGLLLASSGSFSPTGPLSPSPNNAGYTYDPARGKWLPVAPSSVAPDAHAYVYEARPASGTSGGILHVVDAASGTDQPLLQTAVDATVLGWTSSGLYYLLDASADVGGVSVAGPSLWVVDPSQPRPRLLVSQDQAPSGFPLFKAGTWLTPSAVWAVSQGSNSGASGARLIRISLPDGQVTPWVTDGGHLGAGGNAGILGFSTTGNPYILPSPASSTLSLVTAPDTFSVLDTKGFRPNAAARTGVSDGHGLWLTDDQGGVWLLADGSGPQRVGNVSLPTPTPLIPAASGIADDAPSQPQLLPAGACS